MLYEPLYELEKTGIDIQYYTNKGQYIPAHWHAAVELIYILNGIGNVIFEGKDHTMVAGEFAVVDSNQIHELKCAKASMMLVIHYSKNRMKTFIEEVDEFKFECSRETLAKEKVDKYLKLCNLLKRLPPLYVTQPLGYQLENQAVAMEIFFELINHFAVHVAETRRAEKETTLERLGEITDYIERHHADSISLESIASHFYLSREYFSRFFKKNMGVTFSRYVNQVRLMHIYHDICNTGDGVMELAERHGFTNYKLFNRMFHEIYGCTPREVRQK